LSSREYSRKILNPKSETNPNYRNPKVQKWNPHRVRNDRCGIVYMVWPDFSTPSPCFLSKARTGTSVEMTTKWIPASPMWLGTGENEKGPASKPSPLVLALLLLWIKQELRSWRKALFYLHRPRTQPSGLHQDLHTRSS